MQTHKNLLKRSGAINRIQLVLVAALVMTSGVYLVSRTFAANGFMTLVAGSNTVNIGSTVTVTIRENSSTDTVNAVQANIGFDATKLQYVSTSSTGSAFPLEAATVASTGSLKLSRATSGGTPPVAGDNIVAVVTFKAITGGTVALTVDADSGLIRSTDNTDILAVKTGTSLTLSDTGAPVTPSAPTASAISMTGMTLSWAATTDNVAVTGYRLYRNGTQIATTTSLSQVDTGLMPATSYTYKVAAVDAVGNVSSQSAATIASTLADTAAPSVPGKPTSASQTMTSVNLAWTASTDNVGVSSYRVYRNGTQVATPTTNSHVDSGLANNTSYSYTVAAVDAAGNVSAQTAATAVKTLADTQAPSTPNGFKGTVTGLTVALSWNASTDNVGVVSYSVRQDGTEIATTTAPSYTATVASGTHSYTVVAKDAAGNVSATSSALSFQFYIAGDVNRDGSVNVFDLSTLLTNWQRTGVSPSDVNGDSVVNIFDLSILLSKWTG